MPDVLYAVIIYPIVIIIETVFVIAKRMFSSVSAALAAVSLAVSLCTLPLYLVVEKWQRLERNIRAHLKPKEDQIKAVFSDDERFMILQTYYRQNHWHPIYAMRGSLGFWYRFLFL